MKLADAMDNNSALFLCQQYGSKLEQNGSIGRTCRYMDEMCSDSRRHPAMFNT